MFNAYMICYVYHLSYIFIKYILILIPVVFFSLPSWGLDSDKIQTNSEDFETSYNEDEIYDPMESMNRAVFNFNNVADKIILEPVAKGYRKLPSPIQSGVGNFLNNLKMPLVVINQLLQGQGGNAVDGSEAERDCQGPRSPISSMKRSSMIRSRFAA